eukprot:236208_1
MTTETTLQPPVPKGVLNANDLDDEEDEDGIDFLPYSLSVNKAETYRALTEHLPYFSDFMKRGEEESVLNSSNYKKGDPLSYLQAIDDKYDVKHPQKFDVNEQENYSLRPWVQGQMEKLSDAKGLFGADKYDEKMFRLFDEALVWFPDSFLSFKTDEWIKPSGVLPLAMVTGLKTVDIDKMDGKIDEDELLSLELQIEDETILKLRCSDFNQRIKWFECLHTAIFTVTRPAFTREKNVWTLQLIKTDKKDNDQMADKPNHIRMGQTLVLKVTQKDLVGDDENRFQEEKATCGCFCF